MDEGRSWSRGEVDKWRSKQEDEGKIGGTIIWFCRVLRAIWWVFVLCLACVCVCVCIWALFLVCFCNSCAFL